MGASSALKTCGVSIQGLLINGADEVDLSFLGSSNLRRWCRNETSSLIRGGPAVTVYE